MEKIEAKWYAIRTNSKAEKKVHQRLQENGFESFLPLITTVRQWSDRKKKVVLPLIPSYVFLKGTKKDLMAILPISGVVSVLKYLGKPAIVQEIEIENLKIITNQSSKDSVKSIEPCSLKKFTEVSVIDGPFVGLRGVYTSKAKKGKIIVQVDLLNSFTEITVLPSHIEEFR